MQARLYFSRMKSIQGQKSIGGANHLTLVVSRFRETLLITSTVAIVVSIEDAD